MICGVCGRRLIGADIAGKYWVWVHADGSGVQKLGHYAAPVRVARHD